MPIYPHLCPEHGGFDVFERRMRETTTRAPCPECGEPSPQTMAAPARVDVRRDWNEKANEYQRNPYEQAKAQAWNVYHSALEHGQPATRPTEAGIQVAAKAIAAQKSGPAKPDVERRFVDETRKKMSKGKGASK